MGKCLFLEPIWPNKTHFWTYCIQWCKTVKDNFEATCSYKVEFLDVEKACRGFAFSRHRCWSEGKLKTQFSILKSILSHLKWQFVDTCQLQTWWKFSRILFMTCNFCMLTRHSAILPFSRHRSIWEGNVKHNFAL